MLRAGGSATDAAIATMLALDCGRAAKFGHRRRRLSGARRSRTAKSRRSTGARPRPMAATPGLVSRCRTASRAHSCRRFAAGSALAFRAISRLRRRRMREHGKLPWAKLFEPAIRLARDGFEINERLHRLPRLAQATGPRSSAEGRALYLRRGRHAAARRHARPERRRLPRRSKRSPARGPDAFYTGANAATIADSRRPKRRTRPA